MVGSTRNRGSPPAHAEASSECDKIRYMNASAANPAADLAARIAATVRQAARALTAYHVPDASGMIKLDAMENPYRLPPQLRREIGELAAAAALNRYPDPGAARLKHRLRTTMALPDDMELLLGNGSDEIIQLLALGCARPGAVMLGVEPSFAMVRMIATFSAMRYVGVPLRADFSLDTESLLAAIDRERPALLFLAYPNNPSGNLFDAEAVASVIRAAPGVVVVDEAYTAFSGSSFLPRLREFPNLLVMRTLSKLGFAGLRLGLIAGRPEWLSQFDKLRLPYNVNVLTQIVAERVLQYSEVLDEQAAIIRSERGRLLAGLQRLGTLQVYPSDANFILFRLPQAGLVFDGLKQRNVLVKNLDGVHPLLSGCLRVTVGTRDENDQFLSSLAATLAG